jgi:phosphatidylglycerophosphate synthase
VTFEEHLERWQALHGGLDPRATPLVVPWLRLVHLLARPLAALRVAPDLLTLSAVVPAAASLVLPPWPAAASVLLSALLDGLDGGVALLSDRVTVRGARLDTAGDRVCDLLFVAALVVAGAPWWLGIACGFGVLLLEGTRRGTALTVAERPTRVIAVVLGLVSIPTVGLVVLTAATAVALLQLRR